MEGTEKGGAARRADDPRTVGRESGSRPRIAHLSGPNATIQNTPPLVTSNKARKKFGLPLITDPDGRDARYDVLRPQRLAKPTTVYVEQFSAHPLERDAAELYAPPDGYLDADGVFRIDAQSPDDIPVYEVELRPEDGLYPLPYMARQADGGPWEEECAFPNAPAAQCRQHYFPSGARCFEEIDRLGILPTGHGNAIGSVADVDFFRVAPPAGYKKGMPADERADEGDDAIPPEQLGEDFFPYKPYHIGAAPPRPVLARITNEVQRILRSGNYRGAVWTQGSPRIEETIYWFNLLLDVTVPICGTCSQRPHGEISNDGPKNITDAVAFIASDVWADQSDRNRVGAVLIQEQQIFSARDGQKGDARPGGFVTTGGHGGILGAVGHDGPPTLTYLPGALHTWQSSVNISKLPDTVNGVQSADNGITLIDVVIKDGGALLGSAIPKVTIVKDGSYTSDGLAVDPDREVDLLAQIDANLTGNPLSGFVVEGLSPYGLMTAMARHALMLRAVHSGMPVVRVGRGNNDGFTPARDRFIGGRNLTATKARLLLMACLMRFGALPPAADPENPTEDELNAIRTKLARYQEVFDSH